MTLKKLIFLILPMLVITNTGFADKIVLANQTGHPMNESRIGIQWAVSANEVVEANKAIMYGLKQNPASFQLLTEKGKLTLNIPKKAEYFRVVVWSKGSGDPDLLTNWVDIIPNKTYELKEDYLVPAVLMIGSGC